MGPLSDEERADLIPDFVRNKAAVNALEQINIEKAIQWTLGRNISKVKLISERFIKQLHSRMYGEVWKWAGEFRLSNKNIGVPYYQIPEELKMLLDDVHYWLDNDVYSPDELAIRFKHRLVYIHCFPNGNGRHSRLMADLIIQKIFKGRYFSWGGSSLIVDDEKRKHYIAGLHKADDGEVSDLISFARS